MSESIEELLGDIERRLRELGVQEEATVLLIGSVARGRQQARSDVDFLVITPRLVERWRSPENCQIIFKTREEIRRSLEAGDDLPAWALRLGQVLRDPSGWWAMLREDPLAARWPSWEKKVEHARRRIQVASTLLSDGDCEHAEEEYLMGASHVARALLLRAGVFPQSRPELAGQLQSIGHEELSQALEELAEGHLAAERLQEVARVVEDELENLEGTSLVKG